MKYLYIKLEYILTGTIVWNYKIKKGIKIQHNKT